MSNLWPLGIAIYITGTLGEALGANLQRKSLTTENEQAEAKRDDPRYVPRSKWKQRMWVFGFCIFVMAGISMSVSLFFASQTVLAPMQLFLFVFNAIFATIINKETFHWLGQDGIALTFVAVGVTLALISAPKNTESYSNEQLLWLLRQPSFIAFCCFTATFIISIWIIKRQVLASCSHDPRTIRRPWLRTVLNMSYGAVAGAFGGVNVTLTKTVFSLIVGQWHEGGIVAVISSPVLWTVAIVLIGTWFLQLFVTVAGLEATSSIIVISAHSVAETITATSGGILFFQDYLKFDIRTWAIFILGCLLAIFSAIRVSHLRLKDLQAKEEEQQQRLFAPDDNHRSTRERARSDGFLLLQMSRENGEQSHRFDEDLMKESLPDEQKHKFCHSSNFKRLHLPYPAKYFHGEYDPCKGTDQDFDLEIGKIGILGTGLGSRRRLQTV